MISSSVIIKAFNQVVLGNNAESSTNGLVIIDYQYAGVFLSNSADELIISNGIVEIDRKNWSVGFVPVGGFSMELSQNHLNSVDNDNDDNWCLAISPIGGGDLGTPGSSNVCLL